MSSNEKFSLKNAPISEEEKKEISEISGAVQSFARLAVMEAKHPFAALSLSLAKIMDDLVIGLTLNNSTSEAEIREMLGDVVDLAIEHGRKKADKINASGIKEKLEQWINETRKKYEEEALKNIPSDKI